MVHADYLHELLAINTRLCSTMRSRVAVVEYELDRLGALRAGLALAAVPTRKRRRSSDDVSFPNTSVKARGEREDLSPALLTALRAVVDAQRGERRSTLLVYDKEVWEGIAAALHSAGHRRCTPYELWTAFAKTHYAHTPFSAAETTALVQCVQECGCNWAVVGKTLQQRFGSLRSPFDLAVQYRSHLRRAFVQNHLTQQQLTMLLLSDAVGPAHRDYDAVCVEAKRFSANRSLQIDRRYLQTELQVLAFHRDVPRGHHMYWKMMNLMCRIALPTRYRLDAFHYKLALCYQQRSLSELARHFECTTEALKAKVVHHLLGLSRSPDTLSFEECSKILFGNASAARVVCVLASELHGRRN